MENILKPFKAVWTAWKKTSGFFKFTFIWSILLVGVIIGVCVWEWDALAGYQADYNDRYAKAEADASKGNALCIEEYVAKYTKELHREKVLAAAKTDNAYYTLEELVDDKLSKIDFTKISYVKNEANYSDTRPVYDILAGEEVIATVTLGAGSIDEFGFNTWRVSGVSVDSYLETPGSIKLSIEEGMKVTVKDKAPAEGSLTETSTITSNIYDRVKELSGQEENIYNYTLSGILNVEDIKVVDGAGKELSYTEVNGVRVYKGIVDEATQKMCEDAVDPVVQAYVKYTNRWITMEQMLNYTVPSSSTSSAASAIKRSADSVRFAKKPSTINYTSKIVDNIHVISDNLFYCDVYYAISKKVSGKMTDETIKFTLVMYKQNGQWLLDRMAYNG